MVSAKRAAAAALAARYISVTEAMERLTPKPKAAPGSTRPFGNGRSQVRAISASTSRSYHILIAPDAPAPTAMHSTPIIAITGCTGVGARNIPTSPVNTTSDITLGFSSAKKSDTRPTAVSSATLKLESTTSNSNGARAGSDRPAAAYFTSGNSSKVWNGGGDDTVHSSVVAPAPHGLAPTRSPEVSVLMAMKTNSRTPAAEM